MSKEIRHVLLTWLVPAVFLISVVAARFTVGNLLFHSLAEVFTIIVGITITIVSYFTYQFTKNNFLLYLGIGYFWVAILDLFHMLTFKDMNIYSINDVNLTLTFWILARFLEVFVIITAPFINFSTISKTKFFSLFGLLSILVYWLSFSSYLPEFYTDGVGLTLLKLVSEYAIIFLLAVALLIYQKQKSVFDIHVYKYMMISIIFSILAEFTFTLYSDVHGYIIMLGHLFKFLSFWMIFLAIVKTSLEKPFMFLSQEANTYNAIPVPAIVVDMDGIIRQINNSTESFLNLSKEEILHKSNHQLFHNKNLKESECKICQDIKAGNRLESYELFVDPRTYSFTISPINLSNELKGAVQVCIDMSKHKFAEDELKKSQSYLETIIQNEPECVKVVDLEGRLLDMNPAGLNMLQASTLEEAQSQPLLNYVTTNSKNSFMELHKKVTQNGENSSLEFEIEGLNGKRLWLETNAVPMRNDNGEITALLGITRDVTQRKETEQELNKLKIAIEQSPISVMITDVKGCIEYVNPQFLRVTGYTYEEIIGQNPNILSTGYTNDEEYELLWNKIHKQKKTWSGIFKNFKKNAEEYWESAIISPVVDENGTIVNYIGIKQDISEKVALESLLKDKEELIIVQSRHAAMGEMIGMIAHQWRQPLAAIASASVDLQIKSKLERFDLSKEEESREYESYVNSSLHNIDNLVQNLSTTVDDFRNFYKSNKLVVTKRLDKVVLKSLKIIKASLLNDNINIIEEYNSKEEIKVYDSEVMQVILNILKNAQDNFKEKDVKDPYIKITTENSKISICDNGGGIPEEIKDRIFEPYFSTKDEKNGTGLGLYMSKTIIEEHHHGRLIAKNMDNGVCFVLELGVLD